MIRNFLNKNVEVKLRGEGLTIEGMLVHVDNSQGHNGIGNLILADGSIRTIVRGSSVLHVALKR